MFLDTKKALLKVPLQRNYLFEVILPDISREIPHLEVSSFVQRIRFGDYNFSNLTSIKQGPFTSNSAGTLEISEINISILNPIDNLVIEYFKIWKNLIVDPSGFYYPKINYAKIGYCYLYDSLGNETIAYQLINLFPKNFPNFDLDYTQNNLVKFDISFSVDLIKQI